MSRRFTEAEIVEVWERRKAGEPTRSIARRLGRNGSSIRRLFEDAGGVRPAPRTRSLRQLSLVEREEISRGVAAGESLRVIAGRLGRAASTISRELTRNGAAGGIGPIERTGRRGSELAGRNPANWQRTELCVWRWKRNSPIGGHHSRSRAGYGTRTLMLRGCTCRTRRSICRCSSRPVVA